MRNVAPNREAAHNMNREKNKKMPERKVGTEFARGTRKIVKAQIYQNQEENAATESERGKQAFLGSVNHRDGRSRSQTNYFFHDRSASQGRYYSCSAR